MQFIKQLNVKMRAKQRNKRKHREEFREKLYKKGMQQKGRGFYAQELKIITIINGSDLYQSSAFTSIKVLRYLL